MMRVCLIFCDKKTHLEKNHIGDKRDNKVNNLYILFHYFYCWTNKFTSIYYLKYILMYDTHFKILLLCWCIYLSCYNSLYLI